ncbi:MAG: ATP-binding cassette domain-containing protein [Betaproteobacteria bacterium]|nr:ATP-binding cassette domain-containing protein [Betaproteobacteria bacterium]
MAFYRLAAWQKSLSIVFLGAALALPTILEAFGQEFYIGLATRMLIFALAASSLNLILGFGGMVSLGHAAFLGASAYVAAICQQVGINEALIAFPLAMGIAGLAGAMLANLTGLASPNLLQRTQSVTLLVMVIIGGVGYLYGGVLGAVVLLLLEETLAGVTDHWHIVLGLLLLDVVLFAPKGVAPCSIDSARLIMAEALLDVRQLPRRFAALDALKDVDFRIEAGEIHALIGPNGAGKTTFIHHVSGALQPDSSSVHFAARDVSKLSMHQRVAAGMARSYQITNVFRSLSALDNVALAVQGRSDAGSSFRFWRPVRRENRLFDEAQIYLEQVGLHGKSSATASTLSHGEQRALELTMVLATKPQLLLLDEPMAVTGPEESARMEDLIEHLTRHVTILLVEHGMNAVFRQADSISVLVNGQLICTGTPDKVKNDAGVRRAYLGDHL